MSPFIFRSTKQRKPQSQEQTVTVAVGCQRLGKTHHVSHSAWTRGVVVREKSEPQELVPRVVLFFRWTLQVLGLGGSVPQISYYVTVEQLLPRPVS